MRNKAVNQFYSGDQTPEQAAKYLSTQAKPHFDKFERWFLQNGTKFTASDEVRLRGVKEGTFWTRCCVTRQ